MSEITATGTAWKFLVRRNGEIRSQHGHQSWEIGEWYSVLPPVGACSNGFHCSPTPLAALGYVPGDVVAQVEYAGQKDVEGDKSAHEHMRIVRAYEWTAVDSLALSIFAAEQVLGLFAKVRPADSRPTDAIEQAKKILSALAGGEQVSDAASYAASAELAERINAWIVERISTKEVTE